jgi:hypothetical protein
MAKKAKRRRTKRMAWTRAHVAELITVFEGQDAGEENFKADETYRRRIAPKSKSVGY